MERIKCDACGREYEEPIWQPYDVRYNDEDNRKSEKINVCPSCMDEIGKILNRSARVQLAIESVPCTTCEHFNKGKFPFCKKAEDCTEYRDWRCKYIYG